MWIEMCGCVEKIVVFLGLIFCGVLQIIFNMKIIIKNIEEMIKLLVIVRVNENKVRMDDNSLFFKVFVNKYGCCDKRNFFFCLGLYFF